MHEVAFISLLILYILAAAWLLLYGLNNYYILYLFFRNVKKESEKDARFLERFWRQERNLPRVTTQLPLYNERYVAGRLIRSVVEQDYPRHLHEIQVLDDSSDETSRLVSSLVERYKGEGYDIRHIRRKDRSGYKAGALDEGLKEARGEFVAIFDADFLPGKDFLRQTLPFFYEDEATAFVQTRWGHTNRGYSLLTTVQGLALDGHFVIEQGARCWGGLYMNFNGTAGVWRKRAIIDAGGWHSDTLTEDLDLSYRAQLRGWRPKFLHQTVTLSELPIDISAFKTQQHRWAKGSIQTAKKHLPTIFRSRDSMVRKLEAFFHLTHYAVHPLILLLSVLSFPLLLVTQFYPARPGVLVAVILTIMLGAFGPPLLYIVSQRVVYKDWWRRCLYIPALMVIGTGIAMSNTRAVIEGLFSKGGEFVRTPKYGVKDGRIEELKREYVYETSAEVALIPPAPSATNFRSPSATNFRFILSRSPDPPEVEKGKRRCCSERNEETRFGQDSSPPSVAQNDIKRDPCHPERSEGSHRLAQNDVPDVLQGPLYISWSLFLAEIILGLYCLLSFLKYAEYNPRFIFGPFLLIYSIGFLYVGGISLLDYFKRKVKY